MIFTDTIKAAITLALKTHELHQKQKRRGKDVPYIVHPLIVGMLLARAGASDEVIAAGILHDTIEDSHPLVPVTPSSIQKQFGKKIAQLVLSVTENKKLKTYEARKRESIRRIKRLSHESLLIRSADTLSNITELLSDIEHLGPRALESFGGTRGAVLQNHLESICEIQERGRVTGVNPFIDELCEHKKKLKILIDALQTDA
ncbi:MAG: hypothetical protein RI911_881 [Candidatus Parcubacteria bacterium]